LIDRLAFIHKIQFLVQLIYDISTTVLEEFQQFPFQLKLLNIEHFV